MVASTHSFRSLAVVIAAMAVLSAGAGCQPEFEDPARIFPQEARPDLAGDHRVGRRRPVGSGQVSPAALHAAANWAVQISATEWKPSFTMVSFTFALVTATGSRRTDGTLFWKVSSGNTHGGMPSFSFLPEAQRWQLVLHLRALAGTRAERRDPCQL